MGASHGGQSCGWQGQVLSSQITREPWDQPGPLPRPGLLVGRSEIEKVTCLWRTSGETGKVQFPSIYSFIQ